MNTRIKKNCIGCNKEILVFPCYLKRNGGKYCNRKCYFKNKKPLKHSKQTIEKIRKIHKGKVLSQHTKNLIRQKSIMQFKNGMPFSTRKKMSITHKKLGTRPPSNSKGGVTLLNKKLRQTFKYKEWRYNIFIRDDFTCQKCKKKGVKLNADHIIAFAFILQKNNIKTIKQAIAFTELWDLDNGRTLCIPCHKKTDTYLNNGKRKIKLMLQKQ